MLSYAKFSCTSFFTEQNAALGPIPHNLRELDVSKFDAGIYLRLRKFLVA